MPIRFAIIIHSHSNRNCLVIFSRSFLHLRGSRLQSRWNGAVHKCGGCCCWPLTTLNILRTFAVWIPTTRTIFCWAMCSTKIVVANACIAADAVVGQSVKMPNRNCHSPLIALRETPTEAQKCYEHRSRVCSSYTQQTNRRAASNACIEWETRRRRNRNNNTIKMRTRNNTINK